MPTTLEVRRAARRDRVVARLLRVVEGLLEDGVTYTDLKVEDILAADGMARSTFYSYFSDKGELITALGESAMADIIGGAQAIWELPPDASRDDVAGAVRHTIETYLPHTRVMNALLEVAAYDPAVAERFKAGYGKAQDAARRHIEAGQKAGFIRKDLHADEAAGWFTWMAERGMTQLVQSAGRAKLARLEDTFTSILWYSLYEGQGRARTG